MALTSLISMAVIGRRLSPVVQGYWFSFDSLVAARAVFELGFSMVLMQVASHEYASLYWEDGRLAGNSESKARLSAMLRRAVLWYLGVSGFVVGAGWIFGGRLFATKALTAQVDWHMPWIWSLCMTALLIALTPLGALLEGSGKLASVARMRLLDCIISSCCVWAALAAGKGLYALPIGLTASFAVQVIWFSRRTRFFGDIWRSALPVATGFWRCDVWPFQWRIAVSFASGYFVLQAVNPLAFAVVGPVESGRLGMTLLFSQGVVTLASAVVKASAPRFGELIARRQWPDLDRAFSLSLLRSFVLAAALVFGVEVGIIALNRFGLAFAARLMSPGASALILLTAVLCALTQSLGIYLRAHKREPLLWASVASAVISLPANYFFLRNYGIFGAAIGFFVVTGAFNGIWTYIVFRRQRKLHDQSSLQTVAA